MQPLPLLGKQELKQQLTIDQVSRQLVTQGFWLYNLGELRRHPRPVAFLRQTVDIALAEVIIRVLDEQLRTGHNVLKSFHLHDGLRLGTRTDKLHVRLARVVVETRGPEHDSVSAFSAED